MSFQAEESAYHAALSDWWRRHQRYVWSGIISILCLTGGWQYHTYRQNHHVEQASLHYAQWLQAQPGQREREAQRLIKNFAQTPYAGLVLLQQPHRQLHHLKQVLEGRFPAWMKQSARLSMAHQYCHLMQQPKRGLAVLSTVDDHHFQGLLWHIKGDCYAADHQVKAARDAYQVALKSLPDEPGLASLKLLLSLKTSHLLNA